MLERARQATLLAAFALIALLLAAVGVFGVVAYAVAQRWREFGIRAAFGATHGSLRRSVLGYALRLGAISALFGVPAAVAVGYAVRNSLFGVVPVEPFILAGASGVVMVVALTAALLPASRVGRLDPGSMLRAE